jgi:tetratricopeptide (TPR) repeat protein
MNQKKIRTTSTHLFLSTFILCPLLLGGNRDWAFLTIGLMLCASLILFQFSLSGSSSPVTKAWTVRLLLVATGATILQITPLPEPVIAFITPITHEILTISLGENFGWAPLSLDVSQTQHQVIKLIAYLLAVLNILEFRHLLGTKKATLKLLQAIGISGTVVFLIGFGHFLLGYESTFNSVVGVTSLFPSTFINANHLAAFFSLTAMSNLAVYLSLSAKNKPSWPWALNGVAMILGNFLTLSRAGIISLSLTIVLLVICFSARKFNTHTFKPAIVGVTVIPLVAFLSAAVLFGDKLLKEMKSVLHVTSLSKIEIWKAFPELIRDFPLSGIGRGAFAAIFPKYSPVTDSYTFTHLENEWLQLFVDWGVLFGTVILILLIAAFISSFNNSRDNVALWPVVASFCCLGIHNIIDFNISTMGLGLPVVGLLTILGPKLNRSPKRHRSKLSTRSIILGTLMVALGYASIGHSLSADSSVLYQRTLNQSLNVKQMINDIDQAIRRHPGDHYLHSLKARTMLRDKTTRVNTLRTINTVLYLAPNDPFAHLQAADTLYQMGAVNQAFTEYRIALRKSPDLFFRIAETIERKTGDAASIQRLAGYDIQSQIQVAQILKDKGHYDLAIEVLRRHLGDDRRILITLCDAQYEKKDFNAVIVTARRLRQTFPSTHYGYVWGASALLNQEQFEEAQLVIQDGLKKFPFNVFMTKTAAEFYLHQKQVSEATQAIRRLKNIAVQNKHKAWASYLEAELFTQTNNLVDAIKCLNQAYSYNPMEFNYIDEAVKLRVKLGDLRGAIRLLEKALKKSPLHSKQLTIKITELKNTL